VVGNDRRRRRRRVVFLLEQLKDGTSRKVSDRFAIDLYIFEFTTKSFTQKSGKKRMRLDSNRKNTEQKMRNGGSHCYSTCTVVIISIGYQTHIAISPLSLSLFFSFLLSNFSSLRTTTHPHNHVVFSDLGTLRGRRLAVGHSARGTHGHDRPRMRLLLLLLLLLLLE